MATSSSGWLLQPFSIITSHLNLTIASLILCVNESMLSISMIFFFLDFSFLTIFGRVSDCLARGLELIARLGSVSLEVDAGTFHAALNTASAFHSAS